VGRCGLFLKNLVPEWKSHDQSIIVSSTRFWYQFLVIRTLVKCRQPNWLTAMCYLMQAKQRCSVLEDQIVDLIIVAMERSEEAVDDDDSGDDDGYNTSCLQLWQHLSSQLIFFVLFQLSSFPHMVNALYEKVCMLFDVVGFSVVSQSYCCLVSVIGCWHGTVVRL